MLQINVHHLIGLKAYFYASELPSFLKYSKVTFYLTTAHLKEKFDIKNSASFYLPAMNKKVIHLMEESGVMAFGQLKLCLT